MEAFFDAPSGGHSCASVVDLHQHLQHLLQTKVTPTKAEHISVTFELRSDAVFVIPITETEHASLEAGTGIDPRLSTAGAGAPVDGEQMIRHFNAIDIVLNQSQDENLVQRVVAKHIMSVIGQADQSQWMLRSMTRGTEGWTFTYSCKDSWQMWEKAKDKHPPKTLIGEWSNKDGLDPTNMSRPAFDCRGSLTIAFSKPEKAISVKYEHTAMHQTVEQLMNLLAPAPPPEPTRAELRRSAPRKTPRSKRPSQAVDLTGEGDENGVQAGQEGDTPQPKKRRKPAAQNGEGSAQKKRTRKRKTGDGSTDPTLAILLPEMPGARPVGDSSEHPLYNTQPQQDGNGNSAYPESFVGVNGPQGAASAMVSSSVHQHSILNLPAGEAERRREVAIRLLSEKAIDPATLSPRQFSILANQSPELQQESLEMLAKYGAERLKIIVPERDTHATPPPAVSPSPNGQQQAGDAQQPGPAAETPARKGGRQKKPSLKAQETDTSITEGTPKPTHKKKPKLTRGACTPCRDNKLKCDKAKPHCERCLELGVECAYLLEVSRKSLALGIEDADSAAAPEISEPQPQQTDGNEDEEEPDELPLPGFTVYDPELATGPTPQEHQNGDDSAAQHSYQEHGTNHSQFHDNESPQQQQQPGPQQSQDLASMQDNNHQSTTYSEANGGAYNHSSGLVFPQSIAPDATQQTWNSTSRGDYHQASAHSSHAATTQASAARTHDRWGDVTSSQPQRAETPPTTTSHASDIYGDVLTGTSWDKYSPSEVPQAQAQTQATRTSPREARRTAKVAEVAAYQNGMRSVNALAQAALNSVSKPTSPVPQYETAAAVAAAAVTLRAKSRQGHRALAQGQARTPVPNQPIIPRQQQQQLHQQQQQQQQRSAPSITPSPVTSHTAPDKTTTSYKNASYYSTNVDQPSNQVSYQPGFQQTTASTSGSAYPGYDLYNTRTSHRTSNTMPLNNTAAQVATSYTDAPSSSPTRNSLPYSNTSSTLASSSRTMRPSANQGGQRSQAMQNFNVRPQPATHTQSRSSTSTASYGQQSQSPYTSYASQPQQQQHQQTPPNNPNQHGWYVGNTSNSTGSYGTSGARGSGGGGGGAVGTTDYLGTGSGSHGGQHYTQQQQQQQQQQHTHPAMNLSGHTYSSMDGFNILPSGSGH